MQWLKTKELVKEKESWVVFGGGCRHSSWMEPEDGGATYQGLSHGCGAAMRADAQTVAELLIGTG
jgi:hypothetical protein